VAAIRQLEVNSFGVTFKAFAGVFVSEFRVEAVPFTAHQH
jgi:hypothetical protein